MIVEPLVQGAAGMLVQPPGYLRAVRRALRRLRGAADLRRGGDRLRPHRHDVRLRAGGGRARPALPGQGAHRRLHAAGGDARDRARSTRASSARAEEQRTFFHGHTYTGNPLACAAALANLDAFESERTLLRLQPKIHLLARLLEQIAAKPEVVEVRGRGFMVGIDLGEHDPARRIGHRVTLEARRRGAIIRPLGETIVLMPPLSISEGDLQRLVEITGESIEAALRLFRRPAPGRAAPAGRLSPHTGL